MFVGDDFVVTVRHGQGNELHTARARAGDRAGRCSATGPAAVLYAVCDRVVDELPRRRRRAARRRRRDRGVRLLQPADQRLRAHLRAQARDRRGTPGSAAAARADAPARERRPARRTRDGGAVLPRRLRPPRPSRRDRRLPRLAAVDRLRRAPGADLGAAERRHAQDLGRRRAGRGADPDRRRLRHELRAHARARVDLRLPVRAPGDGCGSSPGCGSLFKRSGWL